MTSLTLVAGQKLFIMSVMTSDAGEYECLAENEAGRDSLTFDLHVFGQHQIILHFLHTIQILYLGIVVFCVVPPTIDAVASTSANPQVIRDSSITLNCVAYGEPKPQIKWLKNR